MRRGAEEEEKDDDNEDMENDENKHEDDEEDNTDDDDDHVYSHDQDEVNEERKKNGTKWSCSIPCDEGDKLLTNCLSNASLEGSFKRNIPSAPP